MAENHDADEPPWARDGVVRAVLAYAAVPGAVLALLLIWLLSPITTGDGLARADGLSRWLQAAMTAVIGFYFGQMGTRRAERRARAAEAEAAHAVESMPEVVRAIDDADEKAEALDKLLEKVGEDPTLRQKVDEMLREVGEG